MHLLYNILCKKSILIFLFNIIHYKGFIKIKKPNAKKAFDKNKTETVPEAELKLLRLICTQLIYAVSSAHTYEATSIIDSIYSALKNMGFDGGNILEPALGVGNFLGKMPENMLSSKIQKRSF